MKKLFSKMLCAVLAILIVTAALPFTAMAATNIPSEYTDMELNTFYNFNSNGEAKYLCFVPGETALYRFYSSCDYDCYITLFDNNMNSLSSDDDGGEGGNFKLEVKLTKNKTYYIKVGAYTNWGLINVCVTKPEVANALTITDINSNVFTSYTAHIGDTIRFEALLLPEDSIGEEIVWTVENDDIAEVDAFGNVTFKAIGSTTLVATSGDISDSIEIVCEKIQKIEKNKAITVATPNAYGHLCFQFDVTAGAEHNLYYDWFDGAVATIYDQNGDVVADDSASFGSVIFTPEETATYTAKIDFKNIYKSEITVGTREVVYASNVVIKNAYNGLQYINTAYTFYNTDDIYLSYLMNPSNAIPEVVNYWESSDPTVLEVGYDGQLYFYSTGRADVTLHTVRGLKHTVTINVIEPELIELGTDYTVYHSANNCSIYKGKFSTNGESYHNLKLKFGQPVDVKIMTYYGETVYEKKNITEINEVLDLYTYYDFTIDIRAAFESTNSINNAGTFSITPRIVPESVWFVNTNGEQIYNYNCEVGKEFKLDYIIFPSNAEYDKVTFRSDNPEVLAVSENGVVTPLKEGSASIYIEVGDIANSIYINAEKYEDIALDVPVTAVFNPESSTLRFRFIPNETGFYKFTVGSDNVVVNTWISIEGSESGYIDSWSSSTENSVTYSVLLNANEEYIFYLSAEASPEYEYTVTLSQYPRPDGLKFYYEYQGNYFDSLLGFTGESEWIYCDFVNPDVFPHNEITYTSSDKNIVKVNGNRLDFISAGIATITATTKEGITATFTVEVTDGVELTLNTETLHTFKNPSDRTRFRFTAPNSGYYRLYVDGEDSIDYSFVNSAFENLDGEWINGYYFIYLNEGETAYIKAYNPYSTQPYTFLISTPDYAESISFVDNSHEIITEYNAFMGDIKNFEISVAPNQDSFYTDLVFNSTNTDVAYYSENGIHFIGEGKATITATAYANGKLLSASLDVTVYPSPVITENSLTTVYANPIFDHRLFSFTPETSGVYAFASYGHYDICGAIYDSEGNQLISDDDSGKNNNFYAYVELEGKKTYYLYSKFFDIEYNNNLEYYYDVKVFRPVAATAFVITDGNGNAVTELKLSEFDDSKSLWWKFGPENAIPESVEWTNSNPDVISLNTYSNNIEINVCGTGEATITATTENNLVASVKITVTEAENVFLDTPVDVSLPASGHTERAYYKFIPEKNGYYKFTSYNHKQESDYFSNRGICVYDKNGYEVNSHVNNDWSETYTYAELIAGEEYTILLEKYRYEADEFNFVIREAVVISSMEIIKMPDRTTIYEGTMNYDFTGLIIKATTSDGKSEIWEYSSGKDICGFDYSTGWYGDYESLVAGDIINTTLTAGNFELIIPMTIIKYPIEKIEVITARDIVYIQNTNGWWDDDYYIYNEPTDEIYVKIIFNDGTTKFAPVYSEVDGFYIGIHSDQYSEPWEECGTYNFIVSLGNLYADVPVTIVPSPIVNIELVDKDFYVECEEGTNGFFTNDPFGNRYWHYDLYSFETDLLITYNDGTTETVPMYELDYRLTSDQEKNTWGVGTHSFKMLIESFSIEIPFVVTESDIAKVELTKAPVLSYTYGDIGNGHMDGDEFYPDFNLDESFEFVIYYKNNTSETITADSLDEWNMLYDSDVYVTNNYEPATIGTNTAILCWRNYELKFDYTVVASPIESISVSNLPTAFSSTNFLPNFDGLKLTVNKTDGSSEEITITPDMLDKITRYNYGYEYEYTYIYGNNIILIGCDYEGVFEVYYLGKTTTFTIDGFDITNIKDIEILNITNEKTLYELLITFTDGSEYTLTVDTSNSYDDGGIGGFGPEIIEFLHFGGYGICDKGIYYYSIYAVTYDTGMTEYSVNLLEGYGYEYIEGGEDFNKEVFGDLNEDGKYTVADLVRAKKLLANQDEALEDFDLNGDDVFNAVDMLYMRKALMDACTLTDVYADVDGDGSVTISDALKIAIYLAGSDEVFSSMADINLDGVIDALDKDIVIELLEN